MGAPCAEELINNSNKLELRRANMLERQSYHLGIPCLQASVGRHHRLRYCIYSSSNPGANMWRGMTRMPIYFSIYMYITSTQVVLGSGSSIMHRDEDQKEEATMALD